MPILSPPLLSEGEIVDLSVGVSEPWRLGLVSAGRPVPSAGIIRALVDCGASRTNITPAVIQRLGLFPKGAVFVTTSTTGSIPATFDEYDVSLTILHPTAGKSFGDLRILECQTLSKHYDALLGRDVLDYCLFLYNGPAQMFSLAF